MGPQSIKVQSPSKHGALSRCTGHMPMKLALMEATRDTKQPAVFFCTAVASSVTYSPVFAFFPFSLMPISLITPYPHPR